MVQINVRIDGATDVESGNPISVESAEETVSSLKHRAGVSPDYILTFAGRPLQEDTTLGQLGVFHEGITLFALSPPVAPESSMNPSAQMLTEQVFSGLRLCLSDVVQRQHLMRILLDKDCMEALTASIPELCEDIFAQSLLTQPNVLFRLVAAVPAECSKVMAAHPAVGLALSTLLAQVAGSFDASTLPGPSWLKDPVVAATAGFGGTSEDALMEQQRQARQQQQRQHHRRQNVGQQPAQQAPSTSQQPSNPITSQQLSSALASVFMNVLSQRTATQGQGPSQVPPPSAPPPSSSSSNTQQPVSQLPPSHRFAEQLAFISQTGLAVSEAAALMALEATDGDANAAIELLLSGSLT